MLLSRPGFELTPRSWIASVRALAKLCNRVERGSGQGFAAGADLATTSCRVLTMLLHSSFPCHATPPKPSRGCLVVKPIPKRFQPATWLIGTWRSDKEKTIRRWDRGGAPRPSDGSRREFAASELGKTVNRYTATVWHHTYDETGKFSMPYRVVWQGWNELFIVHTHRRSESGEFIRFISKTSFYLLRSGYAEFFTKDAV